MFSVFNIVKCVNVWVLLWNLWKIGMFEADGLVVQSKCFMAASLWTAVCWCSNHRFCVPSFRSDSIFMLILFWTTSSIFCSSWYLLKMLSIAVSWWSLFTTPGVFYDWLTANVNVIHWSFCVDRVCVCVCASN